METKFLIIDGHNFLYRGYYGVPVEAQMNDGTRINGVYGFFSLLRGIISYIKPSNLLIIFDSETGIKSKVKIHKSYKANRTYDENIFKQLVIIKRCLGIMNISWEENKDREADDVIGMYSAVAMEQNLETCIASNDYDFMQLVSGLVKVARGYHGKIDILDAQGVLARFGVSPKQYLDYLALKGDLSDNIRGISGIGPKRASNLVSRYNDIEGIYTDFEQLDSFFRKVLDGKRDFLIELRDFFRIEQSTLDVNNNLERFSCKDIHLSGEMGNFLNENWKYLQHD